MTGDRYEVHHVGDGAAVGRNATGYSVKAAEGSIVAEVEKRLAELRLLIEAHIADLDEPAVARDAVAAATREAGVGRFDQVRLFLSAITGAATQVAAVSKAVDAVRVLLDHIG